jgi:hypothetical protein
MAGHAQTDLHAIAHSFNASFWWSIGITVVAVIPTLFLAMRKKSGPETSSKATDSQAAGQQ